MKRTFDELEQMTGLPAPVSTFRISSPWWRDWPAKESPESPVCHRRRLWRECGWPPENVLQSSQAIRELGLPQTPLARALADAVEWFEDNGYIRNWSRREGSSRDMQ